VRVLVDATALPENRGGVGRYVDEIITRLPALGVDAHVVAQRRDLARYEPSLGADHVHAAPGWALQPAARLVWEQSGLPILVRRLRPDIVHSPHYTLPLASTVGRRPASVVTLHDATFFSDPDLHVGVKAPFFRAWTSIAARRADALVAPSEATRAEVVRHTRADPDRIAVVPHGVDHEHFRPPSDVQVAEMRTVLKLDPDEPYLAFLGTLEPRKNVPALVRAFAMACADDPRPPTLVLAGGRGWDDGIDPALARLPKGLRVVRPGFLPDSLIPALLGGAEVVAYPGFGEGFGLPVLEAMACGGVVLTTRRLSLAEVGGDAVAYAETPEAVDIAAALSALLADADRRKDLAVRGLERAATYTWDRAARGHVRVYAEALAR
jgi:glycosyltransferase involved in cell wall biosynthesis